MDWPTWSNPLSGDLFIFRNRRGNLLKLLQWEGDRFAIFYKRLEDGAFVFPKGQRLVAKGVEITAADLTKLLVGVDLSSVPRRKHYRRRLETIGSLLQLSSPYWTTTGVVMNCSYSWTNRAIRMQRSNAEPL